MTTTATAADTHRKITTPVITFENAAGRTVTLIGVVHAGTARYYVQIQDLIAVLQEHGARVHVEQVRSNTASELKAASRGERKAAEALTLQLAAVPEMMVHIRGAVHQRGGLIPQDSWEIHDLDKLTVVRIWGTRTVRTIGLGITTMLTSFRQQLPSTQRRIWLTTFNLEEGKPLREALAGKRADVEERREAVALEAMDDAFIDGASHVVLLWGRGHVPGLSAGLISRGFEPVGEERLTAVDTTELPDLAWSDAHSGVRDTASKRWIRSRTMARLEAPRTPR